MDVELLDRKSAQAVRARNRIQDKLPSSVNVFKEDYDAQDIVYRNFVIVIQNCVDAGSHVISSKGFHPPKTMGGVFDVLAEKKIIPDTLGKNMRKMVTLRNIIVHDYARLDHAKAHSLIVKGNKIEKDFFVCLLKESGE